MAADVLAVIAPDATCQLCAIASSLRLAMTSKTGSTQKEEIELNVAVRSIGEKPQPQSWMRQVEAILLGKVGVSRQRAGIEKFRFHDLRHSWASWHVMNGTTLQELMELGGWKSYEMVLRSAHLAPEHLSNAAARIEQRLGIVENDSTISLC
jgi:hypothetical protein